MTEERFATAESEWVTTIADHPQQAEDPLALEIIKVLAPYPRGLRRWSVMRAIRKNRILAGQGIPLKLEAEVERVFRRFCAGADARGANNALFFRPTEKAGEVWAAFPDRVKAWPAVQPGTALNGK